MKIGDILGRKSSKDEVETKLGEADRLMKQKDEIEKDIMEATQIPEPEMEEVQQYQPAPMPHQFRQTQQPQYIPPIRAQAPPQQEKETFRMSVFLENGQKLPVTFKAIANDVPEILAEIDSLIEAKKVFTLGAFKIPGDRVMYIDLEGR